MNTFKEDGQYFIYNFLHTHTHKYTDIFIYYLYLNNIFILLLLTFSYRTLTNVKKNISPQTSSTFPNSNVAARQETKITETNNNVIKKDSELSSSSEDNNKHDSNEDHTFYEKPSKVTRTAKKNFIKKSNENNDDLQELTKAAINICNHLQSDSISNENVSSKSAEQAFAEFVTFSLQRMEESERSIRRNKIFENLTAPLNQLL